MTINSINAGMILIALGLGFMSTLPFHGLLQYALVLLCMTAVFLGVKFIQAPVFTIVVSARIKQ